MIGMSFNITAIGTMDCGADANLVVVGSDRIGAARIVMFSVLLFGELEMGLLDQG